MNKRLVRIIGAVACIHLISTAAMSRMGDGFYMESPSVLNREAWGVRSYLEFGSGAEAMTVSSAVSAQGSDVTVKVDSIRLPVEIRYGLADDIEVGGDFGFETDDGTQDKSTTYFDGSGIQRIRFFGKWNFYNDIAALAEMSLLGNNKLYYSLDSFDFGLKVIYGPQVGLGNLNLNLGFLFKSGEANFAGGNTKITGSALDYATVFNYGIGYVYPYNDRFTGIFEFAGSSSPFKGGGGVSFSDLLNFVAAGRYGFTDKTAFEAGVGIGLGGGSPNFLLRVGLDVQWGVTESTGYSDYTPPAQKQESRWPEARETPAKSTPPAASTPKKSQTSTESPYYEPAESKSEPAPAYQPASSAPPEPARSEPRTADRIAQYVTDAASAFQRGDYVSAVSNYQSAIRLKTDDPVLHYNLATAYFQQKQYADAKTYYKNALTLNPSDVDCRLYLGYTLYYLQDTAGATREWKKVLELDPSNALAKENLQTLSVE